MQNMTYYLLPIYIHLQNDSTEISGIYLQVSSQPYE